ncbi:hypothetical protein [Haloglomus litoreum]|uniref:hypothetical protein n=1 Tax=Haloglomus litoreum TaxID=3034026 RepID=UPI0023E78D2F|nr:hypothetical protein [Haloglomus sp. DT116]
MSRTDGEPTDGGDGLTEPERAALHDLELGLEHVRRGYGALVTFHHQIGRGMDRFDDARARLREAGHDDLADRLRDEVLPAGAVGDRWSYELVADFRREFLADVTAMEADAREALAEGGHHLTERRQQARWRDRAEGEAWRVDGEKGAERRGTED